MKTNVFSNETLNAAVKVMNESQAEMSKLREQATSLSMRWLSVT